MITSCSFLYKQYTIDHQMYHSLLLGKEQSKGIFQLFQVLKNVILYFFPKLASKWQLAFRRAAFVQTLLIASHLLSTRLLKIVLQLRSPNFYAIVSIGM